MKTTTSLPLACASRCLSPPSPRLSPLRCRRCGSGSGELSVAGAAAAATGAAATGSEEEEEEGARREAERLAVALLPAAGPRTLISFPEVSPHGLQLQSLWMIPTAAVS